MSNNEDEPQRGAKPKLRSSHRTTIAFRSTEDGRVFSDLSAGYYESALTLHNLGREDAAKWPANTSKFIPPSIVLYSCALDAYLNSLLGRIQLYTDRVELAQSCYDVATSSLSSQKVRDFLWILQLGDLLDESMMEKISVLANLRGEVVHIVPTPGRRNEWKGRVLEAIRQAGVPRDEFKMLDSQAALSRVELADWSQNLVDTTTALIQGHFGWPPAFT